ncbi:MAG: DNA polymerase IV [Burkholderiales bacterium]|nr:DNA polymerase IV [Burkholderiales bacterium]
MDAFYASVELLRYPELRGLPVVIGGHRHAPQEIVDPTTGMVTRKFARLGDYVGRGVATTATYEARRLGLHSAQGLMKGAALAPDATLLPVDFDRYRHYSRLFKRAVREIAPRIEDHGIDEIFLDLSDVRLSGADDGGAPRDLADAPDAAARNLAAVESEVDAWWRARDVAKALKAAVRDATGLSCSIAVAPNKLLAKIASELDKPDGLTMLKAADVPTRIWPLPPRRINGIGPKASAKLDALGITSIGALAHADLTWLMDRFGRNYGAWLHRVAHGEDDREVVTDSEPVSISRETTFERDLSAQRDRAELGAIFTELCESLARDLARKGYAGRTVGVKLRFDNFATVTRDHTLAVPIQGAQAIRHAAGLCLKRAPLTRRIRLLGVRISSLTPLAGDRDGLARVATEHE